MYVLQTVLCVSSCSPWIVSICWARTVVLVFLVRGNVKLERDLELGQLRLESGSGSHLLFSPGR